VAEQGRDPFVHAPRRQPPNVMGHAAEAVTSGTPKAADCRKEASLLFGGDASACVASALAAVIPGWVWDLFGGSPALAATGWQLLDGDSRGNMG